VLPLAFQLGNEAFDAVVVANFVVDIVANDYCDVV
jgi:hypothetical protein